MSENLEVDPKTLVQIIGEKEVEILLLRANWPKPSRTLNWKSLQNNHLADVRRQFRCSVIRRFDWRIRFRSRYPSTGISGVRKRTKDDGDRGRIRKKAEERADPTPADPKPLRDRDLERTYP